MLFVVLDEPNNNDGREDCGEIQIYVNKWNDKYCNVHLKYICQLRPIKNTLSFQLDGSQKIGSATGGCSEPVIKVIKQWYHVSFEFRCATHNILHMSFMLIYKYEIYCAASDFC